jgi:hypothetical protein
LSFLLDRSAGPDGGHIRFAQSFPFFFMLKVA